MLDNLKYYQGDYFVPKKKLKRDKNLKGFLKQLGNSLLQIDSVELNFKGEIGYRLAFTSVSNKPKDIVLGNWWVSERYLEQNFDKVNKSTIRFVLMNLD